MEEKPIRVDFNDNPVGETENIGIYKSALWTKVESVHKVTYFSFYPNPNHSPTGGEGFKMVNKAFKDWRYGSFGF